MPDPGLLASLALARGTLDRAAEKRDHTEWWDAAWRDDATRVVTVHRGRTLVRDGALLTTLAGANPGDQTLGWLPYGLAAAAPDKGGATSVCNARAAYEALPDDVKLEIADAKTVDERADIWAIILAGWGWL